MEVVLLGEGLLFVVVLFRWVTLGVRSEVGAGKWVEQFGEQMRDGTVLLLRRLELVLPLVVVAPRVVLCVVLVFRAPFGGGTLVLARVLPLLLVFVDPQTRS